MIFYLTEIAWGSIMLMLLFAKIVTEKKKLKFVGGASQ